MQRNLSIICLAVLLTCGAAAAQDAAHFPRVHGTVTGDPLGYVFFGPSVAAEVAVGSRFGLLFGLRDLEQGEVAQRIAQEEDNTIEEGLLYTVGLRCYRRQGARLSGWYVGPRVEFGNVDTDSARAHAVLLEVDCGRTWITRYRLVYGASVQLGAGTGWNRNTRFASDTSDTEYYLVGNLGVFAGIAF